MVSKHLFIRAKIRNNLNVKKGMVKKLLFNHMVGYYTVIKI